MTDCNCFTNLVIVQIAIIFILYVLIFKKSDIEGLYTGTEPTCGRTGLPDCIAPVGVGYTNFPTYNVDEGFTGCPQDQHWSAANQRCEN